MKTLKHFALSLALILIFAVSALAGDIYIPAPPPPPPDPSSMTTPGVIDTPAKASETPTDSAALAALNLLQTLLTVF